MDCRKCSRPGKAYLDSVLCDVCFCQMIEKRLRKRIRGEMLFSGYTTIVCNGALVEHLCRLFLHDRALAIKRVDIGMDWHTFAEAREGVLVCAWTSDHESIHMLTSIFDGWSHSRVLGTVPHVIKLLLPITDEEAARYAEIVGVEYVSVEGGDAKKFLDHMAKHYPQLWHQVGKSAQYIGMIQSKDI